MPRLARLSTALLLGLGVSIAVTAAEGERRTAPDQRVIKILDAEGLKYSIEDSGEISVVIEWSNDAGRTQLVRIPSSTFRWQQAEYRDVYSVAFETAPGRAVDAALADRLLIANNDSTLGFFAKQGDVVMNIARIPANAAPSMLREAIFFVGETADELEKEQTGKDDY